VQLLLHCRHRHHWLVSVLQVQGTPLAIVVNAALASFAGSLAADRIAIFVGTMPGVVLGALAGLFSALTGSTAR
jgi:hypothetical protein